jgi:hypothetical protein
MDQALLKGDGWARRAENSGRWRSVEVSATRATGKGGETAPRAPKNPGRDQDGATGAAIDQDQGEVEVKVGKSSRGRQIAEVVVTARV